MCPAKTRAVPRRSCGICTNRCTNLRCTHECGWCSGEPATTSFSRLAPTAPAAPAQRARCRADMPSRTTGRNQVSFSFQCVVQLVQLVRRAPEVRPAGFSCIATPILEPVQVSMQLVQAPTSARSRHYGAWGRPRRKPRQTGVLGALRTRKVPAVAARLHAAYPGIPPIIVGQDSAVFRFGWNFCGAMPMPSRRPRIVRRRPGPNAILAMLPFEMIWTSPETGRRLRLLYATRLDAERARDALLDRARPT